MTPDTPPRSQGVIGCPHCGKEFADRERVHDHIYNAHGKILARLFKPEYPARDTEAEYIIQGMIGER